MAYNNLYDGQDFFKLLIGDQEYFVDEPTGWNEINITLSRDKDFYGFNYEFADSKQQLVFTWKKYGGADILFDMRASYGSDADVTFQYGYIETGVQKVQFSGKVNFNEYSSNDEGVSVSIEKMSFEGLFRTRYDTEIDLSATKSLDNEDIEGLNYFPIQLHSKLLVKQTQADTPEEAPNNTYNSIYSGNKNVFYIQPDTTSVQISEIDEIESMPLGATVNDPFADDLFQFKAIEAGPMTVTFSATGALGCIYTPPVLYPTSLVRITAWYGIKFEGDFIRHDLEEIVYPQAQGDLMSIPDFNFPPQTFTVNLAVNDTVFWGWRVNLISTYPGVVTFNDFRTFAKAVQNTQAPPSPCNSHRVFDAISQAVYAATGVEDAVRSEFFGEGGCGEKFVFTNGYQIRQFKTSERPIKASLKNMFLTLASIWNIGVGFKTEPSGKEVVFFEPMDFFFGKSEAYRCGDIYEYQDLHNKEWTFNEIEIGYDKFAEEDLNSLDEFNTYLQLLMPIKTFKSKKMIKSPAIASGYSIELQRREQFKTNPSESITGDDNLFIIAYTSSNVTYTVATGVLSFMPPPSLELAMRFGFSGVDIPANVGDVFTMNGGQLHANDGVEFTITEIIDPHLWKVTPKASQDIADNTTDPFLLTFENSQAQAERNQAFETVDGVISAATSYNLRIAPAYMLRNWASYFNVCLDAKQDTDVIKNTFQKQNNTIVTKFSPDEPCTLGIDEQITHAADIQLLDFKFEQRPFGSMLVRFKTKIPYHELNDLKALLRGEVDGDIRNHGYIVYNDLNNVPCRAHVNKIEYNPVIEEAYFEVFKISEI